MPWQTAVVVQLQAGNTIINTSGDFIYDGSPGAGKLIIALAPAAGTDNFANTFIKGIQVGKATDSAQVAIIPGSGGASAVAFPIPSLSLGNTPNVAGGASGGTGELVLSGPGLAAPGFRDWVQNLIFSNDGAGTAARWEYRYITDAQAAVIQASYDDQGFAFANNITGYTPFTVTREVWHTLGAFGNGWTTQHGRYRITPEGELEIDISLTGSGTTGTNTFPNSLASGYLPVITRRIPGVPCASTASHSTINTGGSVSCTIPAGAATFDACGRVPLT